MQQLRSIICQSRLRETLSTMLIGGILAAACSPRAPVSKAKDTILPHADTIFFAETNASYIGYTLKMLRPWHGGDPEAIITIDVVHDVVSPVYSKSLRAVVFATDTRIYKVPIKKGSSQQLLVSPDVSRDRNGPNAPFDAIAISNAADRIAIGYSKLGRWTRLVILSLPKGEILLDLVDKEIDEILPAKSEYVADWRIHFGHTGEQLLVTTVSDRMYADRTEEYEADTYLVDMRAKTAERVGFGGPCGPPAEDGTIILASPIGGLNSSMRVVAVRQGATRELVVPHGLAVASTGNSVYVFRYDYRTDSQVNVAKYDLRLDLVHDYAPIPDASLGPTNLFGGWTE